MAPESQVLAWWPCKLGTWGGAGTRVLWGQLFQLSLVLQWLLMVKVLSSLIQAYIQVAGIWKCQKALLLEFLFPQFR